MKNINTMRVFFAVIPPSTVCDSLSRSIAALKKQTHGHSIQWMPINKLHITLQFLNELKHEHLTPLNELVCSQLKKMPSFQLQLGHLAAFPTSKNSKIISLTVEPHTALLTLSQTIGQAMSVLGYPVESRPFHGHMTLARLHHDKLQTDLFSQILMPSIPPILIREIYLIESRPDKEGSQYLPLAQFYLNHHQLRP